MSRRLRIEEEKAKQLKDELAEEEDKIRQLFERIYAPLIWRTLSTGIQIQDLQANYYDEVIDMILDHYISEDVIYRNTKIAENERSIRSFADRLRFRLSDKQSIIAIDLNNENAVAGCLMLTAVSKLDHGRVYSRSRLVEGKPYRSIMEFLNYVGRKSDVFASFDCDIYLRYYLLCIKPEYRKKSLGYHLMQTGIDIARHLRIPVVYGIFTNHKTQKNARKIGMTEVLFDMKYITWGDKTGELVFCDPGAGNYSCAAMAGLVPPPPEPEPPPKTEDEPVFTREEKKKLKVKMAAKKEAAALAAQQNVTANTKK